MKPDKDNISLGASFSGFISGIGLVIAVIGAFSFNTDLFFIFSILIIAVGILIFLAIKGVQIDYSTNEIREYYNYFIFKVGFWESLSKYNRIVLKRTDESKNMLHPTTTFLTSTVRIRCYDVFLYGDSEEDRMLLFSIEDYNAAKGFFNEYAEKLSLEKIDLIEQSRIKHSRTGKR